MTNKRKTCCICGKEIERYGNDPWPVKDEGQCCDKCNFTVVNPARKKQWTDKHQSARQ